MNHSNKLIVGIDLGTTHSLVASTTEENAPVCLPVETDPYGSSSCLLPSVVAYDANGHVISVGRDAIAVAKENPARVVFSIKRLMGRTISDIPANWIQGLPYPVLDAQKSIGIRQGEFVYFPKDISACILQTLKKRAEQVLKEPVQRAVITVPAYFDEAQRQATKTASLLAGIEPVRLVNEPTAAALAYGLHTRTSGNVLVYDLGGGTFDVSILRLDKGVFEVLATAGNTELGGDDFDRALAQLILDKCEHPETIRILENPAQMSQFIRLAEQAKKKLSTQEEVEFSIQDIIPTLEKINLTRKEFEEVTNFLLKETITHCKQALRDAKIEQQEIDEIILVGGATRMPMVTHALISSFGKTPLCSINPDEVVAMGAAVQANILMGHQKDMLLLDVTPLSLGLETMGGGVAKLIHRNSTLPVQAQEIFTTYQDNQTAIDFHIVQGERELAANCRSLAKFKLRSIPPMAAGMARIVVHFTINVDGLLEVDAFETHSGKSTHVEVKPSYGLDDATVENMLLDAYEHAEIDMEKHLLIQEQIESKRVLAALEKALAEDAACLEEKEKKEILRVIESLQQAVDKSQDRHLIYSIREELEQTTTPFAQKRMDRSILQALRNKKPEEV